MVNHGDENLRFIGIVHTIIRLDLVDIHKTIKATPQIHPCGIALVVYIIPSFWRALAIPS